MKVDIYNAPDLFEHLQPEWNPLVERSSANMIFSTWEWHYHWWQSYQPGTLWVLTFRNENQELVGIAPWFVESQDGDKKVIRCIGSDDVTDYLDVIIEQGQEEAVFSCLAEILTDSCPGCTELNLSNIPAASPTYQRFPAILEQHGFSVTLKQQEVCPVIVLPDTFEDYLNSLESKQRSEIRRKMRRAEGYNAGSGTLSWYIVDETHDIHTEIERFITVMRQSHPEKALFLTNEQHVKFFRSMIPAAFEKGWLQLGFLMIDGEVAASYFNFVYDNQVLVYNSGLNPGRFADLSAGIILLVYMIQHAIENHRTVFDFLRGNEQYKYRMGAKDTPVYNLATSLSRS